jgi:error-prone DNA polymerase
VNPDLYEKYRKVINREKFLLVEGVLQNQDNVIAIKASRVMPIFNQRCGNRVTRFSLRLAFRNSQSRVAA